MEVVKTREAMVAWAVARKAEGQRIGLVPTMGYLHQGHLDLIRIARSASDRVVVSIFVNPTQFGPKEDLAAYPRDFESDVEKCRTAGADLVFAPEDGGMYDPDHSTWVLEDRVSAGLCGRSRPGHFRGVLTVCAKLFNVSGCAVAVFGQKDLQQVTLIEKMVRELDMPLRIMRAPIRRESDGLAMSSRNAYLTPDERSAAPWLYEALSAAAEVVKQRESMPAAELLGQIRRDLSRVESFRVDYLEVVDRRTLEPAEVVRSGQAVIAAAVFLGRARLIDNVEV